MPTSVPVIVLLDLPGGECPSAIANTGCIQRADLLPFALQFESQGVPPRLLEQTALLNVVTNNVPKLTQCRILNITSVSDCGCDAKFAPKALDKTTCSSVNHEVPLLDDGRPLCRLPI